MMFDKDIIGWALIEWPVGITGERPDRVQEVHLLKSGDFLTGPRIPKTEWKANQRAMKKPYPRGLRRPIEVLVSQRVKQLELV